MQEPQGLRGLQGLRRLLFPFALPIILLAWYAIVALQLYSFLREVQIHSFSRKLRVLSLYTHIHTYYCRSSSSKKGSGLFSAFHFRFDRRQTLTIQQTLSLLCRSAGVAFIPVSSMSPVSTALSSIYQSIKPGQNVLGLLPSVDELWSANSQPWAS